MPVIISLLELFCHVDTFCNLFQNTLKATALQDLKPKRKRKRGLYLSEVLTLLICFHQSGYRTFKDFYTKHVCLYWRAEFPRLVSYNRFVEYIPEALVALSAYLHSLFAKSTGVNYIDSTALAVCNNRRIHQHKVFKGFAQRGKTSMGWLFGFKLHLVVNHLGELVNVTFTPGNTDDRKSVLRLLQRAFGKVFGDKGYVSSKLSEQVREQLGIFLCNKLKRGMQNMLMLLEDKILLRKRGMIESVIDCLKNEFPIEHTRHRSVTNAFVHLLAGLVAYCHRRDKPSIVHNGLLKLAS